MIGYSSNLAEVIDLTNRRHQQFAFASAVALTRTIQGARGLMPALLASSFDKPTAFTARGFFVQRASKASLSASLGVMDKQAQYLQYQIDGGARAPKNKALRLPSVVKLDDAGNLPVGVIKQLIARAKAGKRATKRQASRFGVSQQLDLFYGDPGDGRPAGIYKRVQISETQRMLVPVIVMPQQSAHYERRFDFYEQVDRYVRAHLPAEHARAWGEALASAR